jgi:intracellular sulfur oxidation DsrE/DsrF family protein
MKPSLALHSITAAVLLAVAVPAAQANPAVPSGSSAAAGVAVVYHVSEVAAMRDALNNVTNHLATVPGARITLLANARAVYGLVHNERDRQGEYASTISDLQAKGVKFVACSMSMKKNNIVESSLLPNVSTVTSGVVELTRLQAVEHQAYIKP